MEVQTQRQILVVVGQQRTGTTALNLTLSKSSAVHSFGEVFHSVRDDISQMRDLYLDPSTNFFNFKMAQVQKDPSQAINSAESQEALFEAFLAHLGSLTSKSWTLLDIKYNSWMNLQPIYSNVGDQPFLLHLLRKKGAAIVHLRRRRIFDRYCSEQLALQRWRWHEQRGSEQPTARLRINPRQALLGMTTSERMMDIFSGFLNDWPRRLDLDYDDLFDGVRLSRPTVDAIGKLLGTELDLGEEVPLQKVTPPLSQVVENRYQVWEFFRGSRYGADVAEALGLAKWEGTIMTGRQRAESDPGASSGDAGAPPLDARQTLAVAEAVSAQVSEALTHQFELLAEAVVGKQTETLIVERDNQILAISKELAAQHETLAHLRALAESREVESRRLADELANLRGANELREAENLRLADELANLRSANELREAENLRLADELANLRSANELREAENRRLVDELANLRSANEFREAENLRLGEDLANLRSTGEIREVENLRLAEDLANLRSKSEAREAELAGLQSKGDALEAENRRLAEQLREVTAASVEIDRLKEELKRRLDAGGVLEGLLSAMRRELEMAKGTGAELEVLRRRVAFLGPRLAAGALLTALLRNSRHFVRQRGRIRRSLRLLRGPGGVDASWYRHQYSDIAASRIEPAMHYLLYGAYEGRNPNAHFSTTEYTRQHPEVWESGIDPMSHSLGISTRVGS